MDDAILLSAGAVVLFLIGMGIYLLVDAINTRARVRAELLDDSGQSEALASKGVRQLDYVSPPKRRQPFPLPSSLAIFRCSVMTFAFLILLIVFAGVYEYYEYVPRQAVLTFVDAVTGAPVELDLGHESIEYAPMDASPGWQCTMTGVAGNVVRVDWNCATSLFISQKGYQGYSVDLKSDQSPRLIKLQPIASPSITLPATASGSGAVQQTTRPAH